MFDANRGFGSRYRGRENVGSAATTGAVAGGGIGVVLGVVGSTVATIWGGYELGTAINNALHLEPTVARGVIDLVTMAVIAGPVYTVGIYAGGAAGAALGAAGNATRAKVKNIDSDLSDKL